jgi:putative ABC transport system permease protein
LPENQSKEQFEARFPDFVNKYYSKEDAARQTYLLQSLSTIHFDQEYEDNPGTSTISSSILIVLGCIALFILIIACVNFINLSTALSIRKGKEVGVRKTLGAQQGQLALQYLSEAFLLTLIASVISLGIAEIATPALGQFLEKNLSLSIVCGCLSCIGIVKVQSDRCVEESVLYATGFIGVLTEDIGGGSVFYCSGTDYLYTRSRLSDSIFSK